eukprot:GHVQ01005025.1.p1 GENE.GHVQ01005025.1~~GHVQ01005025.1.p1  ORF type:complete len:289 (-),score=84.12 GHVQ01005025.1:645-1511(-)
MKHPYSNTQLTHTPPTLPLHNHSPPHTPPRNYHRHVFRNPFIAVKPLFVPHTMPTVVSSLSACVRTCTAVCTSTDVCGHTSVSTCTGHTSTGILCSTCTGSDTAVTSSHVYIKHTTSSSSSHSACSSSSSVTASMLHTSSFITPSSFSSPSSSSSSSSSSTPAPPAAQPYTHKSLRYEDLHSSTNPILSHRPSLLSMAVVNSKTLHPYHMSHRLTPTPSSSQHHLSLYPPSHVHTLTPSSTLLSRSSAGGSSCITAESTGWLGGEEERPFTLLSKTHNCPLFMSTHHI